MKLDPHVNEIYGNTTPFYVTLSVHGKLLHNCMLESRSSHILIAKVIMEQFDLDITNPYHEIYSCDSRKVKILGMINDLMVTLAQLPTRSIMMDVVVVDVPTKYECCREKFLWIGVPQQTS